MSFKPADFLIGIVELLAFIVPGVIVFTTLPKIISWNIPEIFRIVDNPNVSILGWLNLIFVSYILGHFIHHISALILNPLYKKFYLSAKRKKHAAFVNKAEQAIGTMIPEHIDILRVAEAFVKTQQPTLIPELEKHEANAKLFRALTILLLYLCFYPDSSIWFKIALILMSILSFSKFSNQRWTQRLVVYEYFTILTALKPPVA